MDARLGRKRHNSGYGKSKDVGPPQTHEYGAQGRTGPGARRERLGPPLSRGARDLETQAGSQAHPGFIDKRLASIESHLVNADALTKLHLLQEQKDLTDERLRVAKEIGRAHV